MNKNIYPCLWFDGNAPEAARFYCSVFNNTKITAENPLVTMLELSGQKLMLLNGGPHFTINQSIHFFLCSMRNRRGNRHNMEGLAGWWFGNDGAG